MAYDITDPELLQDIRAAQGEMIQKLHRQNLELKQKAAALDAILASWGGMTWEQYRTQTGTDAPDTGREPNEHGKENRVEAPQGDDPRRA